MVDAGPFTPGSNIAVPFVIPMGCTAKDNVFQVYLSDQNGNFASEKLIGTYTGFYSTYINGVIPAAGITPGTGYKVRVKTTSPATVSSESTAFEIKAGAAVEAKLTSTYLNVKNTETFGTCISRPNNSFLIQNGSTANGKATAEVKNEVTGAVSNLDFSNAIQIFTADLVHYTITAKNVMPDGTVATKAYLLINNKAITAFGTSGNNLVCLPMGFLEFNVDINSPAGIQHNFPGDLYTIIWGDGTTSTYTVCDIIANGGKVVHSYNRSSCGSTSVTGAGIVFNAFPVTINVSNAFCGTVGTPVSSSAKVVVKPINSFSFKNPACTNTTVVFTNTSVLGENPDTNTPECTPNVVTYNWYVDGVPVQANKPRSYNFETKFLTRGEHVIRLESNVNGACNADPAEMKICIQDPPKPAFTLAETTVCAGAQVKATDQSVLDNICSTVGSYLWVVSPGVTYAGGTSSTSKEPVFNFTNPGVYTIVLNITTPSCGLVASAPQTVVVNATPKATLAANITLCNLAVYDFSPTTVGPTKTTFSGTSKQLTDTYTWTVTPAGSGKYSFVNGTTVNSMYPSIKFEDYDEYTVTVVHKNNCGSSTATQALTFTTAPVINAGADQRICFTDTTFPLNGSIIGTVSTKTWIGGLGTFSPNRNDLNAVYTPTAAEKKAGTVTLWLRATTTLASPCNEINDELVLTIKPDIKITSDQAKTICTGSSVNYTATNAVNGSTFSWTATATSNITGLSVTGNGPINDVLTNSDLVNNGTVTYTIIPHGDGCDGEPFTFVVTVTPKPIVTAAVAQETICNKTPAGITLSSVAENTKYTYTSTITGNITGNTIRNTGSADLLINDILINSGTSEGTVTYTITPLSAGGCAGTPVSVTIKVVPGVTAANAGLSESLCNITSYTLKGNAPVVGTGKWAIVSAANAITFDDINRHDATVSGLVAGKTYVLRWTIANGTCESTSDDVEITINPSTVGGTLSSDLNLCAGTNNGQISLTGEVGKIVRWERSIDNGITWATITSAANPYLFTNLTVTTKFRAIVQSGSCAEAASTITTITVNPNTVVANAGANQSLCNGGSVSLNGNNPAPNSGVWTLVSGQADVAITDPTLFNTNVTGLKAGNVYKFRWTIDGFTGCPPSISETTITYFAPIANMISLNGNPFCAGQGITITGDLPTGGSGGFTYQWQSSADGIMWSNIPSATDQNFTLQASTTIFYRRLVNSTICTSISNELKVTVLPALTNNTISANQQICAGNAVAPLIGAAPVGGNGSYAYQWQASTNGTNWSDVIGATEISFAPPLPTATIYYRRLVSSGPCNQTNSNAVKITVNPPAKAEITFIADKGCAPFELKAGNVASTQYPDRNAVYTWFANDVPIGTGANFPGYTLAKENETVVIKLIVTSSLGCKDDEAVHTFSTFPSVKASYTQNVVSGCGPLNVTFTNTSSSLTGATFKWNFGNGNTSSLAQPSAVVYQPDPAGKDVTYTVTMEATTTCGVDKYTSTVLVKAKPLAVFSPDKTAGCSPFAVTFSNTSPGNSSSYTYDFGDGETLTVNDKSNVTHTYTTNTVKNYVVKMLATNECGTHKSSYTLNVSPNTITPELVVNSNQLRGCAPLKVDFHNNTKGASTFVYEFGDGSTVVTNQAPEVVTHTFTKAGKYKITLYASNGCSNASTVEEIEVLEQPVIAFGADKTSGCDGFEVKFKNTSKNAIGYVWDFGDGTTSTAFEPAHTYKGIGQQYVVTLTATNIMGCSNSVSMAEKISVNTPPVATFTVTPGNELSIPNYTFGFRDISVGAVSWAWDFGDGSVSTQQNPNHTYANEGTYRVALKIISKEGCSATTYQSVRIIGIPGYLNLPNSFMPASAKHEIKTFKAKGRGIKEWRMSVFNKWGQLLWETTQLDDGAPLEGWDGTFGGQEQPQGVYYWKVEVKFVNGSDWKGMTYDASAPKKTGVIYLIR